MSNIYFTSDTHFRHKNIIKFCNRPFKSIEEMNETIIENWNKTVSKGDTIYHLGDFGFGHPEDVRKIKERLNGNIEFIFGNHDKSSIGLFKPRRFMLDIRIGEQSIVMCHFAMRTWNKSHFNSWHLYGHSHGSLEGYGKSFDVGVDAWNFTPISFEKVKAEMEKRPDNFNVISDDKHKRYRK
ncbi:metallophosphoesterase family protein [Candidatus Pacearchaeota archaeon]|nr:metallophosphoesterase family protein [Candidatus Pacearchaeota archaeon]